MKYHIIKSIWLGKVKYFVLTCFEDGKGNFPDSAASLSYDIEQKPDSYTNHYIFLRNNPDFIIIFIES